jgi:hypothetical protein
MFDVGQKVTVISDKGISYDGVILARATDENGQGAYKISLDGSGPEQAGQWHKASDVFVREKDDEDTQISWENLSQR